jgi:hypothetical protein
MSIIHLCLKTAVDIQATKSISSRFSLKKIFVEGAAVSSLKIISRNEEEVLDKQGMLR